MRVLSGDNLIRPCVGELAPMGEGTWYSWYRWFQYVFGALTLVAIVGALTDSSVPRERGLTGIACAVALVGWFWLRGRWGTIRSNGDAILYFAVAVPLLMTALRQYDGFGLMIFPAYWQGFAYFRLPAAMSYGISLTFAIQVAYSDIAADSGGEFEFGLTQILIGILSLLVAGMMAAYMESVGREADRRQHLLNELRATQDALAAREREAGVLAERQRLAGEIHDTVAQQFTSIVTNLEAAEVRATSNPEAAHAHLRAAKDAARQGILDARAMVQALQPSILQGRSLDDALREIAGGANGFARASFASEGEPAQLDRVRETILARGLQESLHNVRKHAGATRVDVRLSWLEDEVILEVEDDGDGFDPEGVPGSNDGHRMGLATMRNRVESAGGTWMVDSTPGDGTSIAISFPLDRAKGA